LSVLDFVVASVFVLQVYLLIYDLGRLVVTEFNQRLELWHAAGGAVVEALRYKPEGRGIDSRWCHWNFSLT
jgi:hypothetical protein